MDGASWAASAMNAARDRLDIATGNLANAGSDGFRRRVAVGAMTRFGALVHAAPTTEQGALRRTGRSLDLALVGSGAFTLRDARGVVTHTRNGAFSTDRLGRIVDDSGRMLCGARGAVAFPPGATISSDGSVRLQGAVIGRIFIPQGASVHSGFLETANVNAISEMVDVLSAQRSFESAQKVLSVIDSAHQKACNELARLK